MSKRKKNSGGQAIVMVTLALFSIALLGLLRFGMGISQGKLSI